jgi:hypothetical protein
MLETGHTSLGCIISVRADLFVSGISDGRATAFTYSDVVRVLVVCELPESDLSCALFGCTFGGDWLHLGGCPWEPGG